MLIGRQTSNISLEDIDKIFLPQEMQDYASRHNSLALANDDPPSYKGEDSEKLEKALEKLQ